MLKHQEYIPVSQIVPVQPALHVQLLGDAQVPCTHCGTQIAKNTITTEDQLWC